MTNPLQAAGAIDKAALLALLYDWHNHRRLQQQMQDISYYQRWLQTYQASDLLVVGSGTGRLAVPLSAFANSTLALDKNSARLARLPQANAHNLTRLVSDICRFRSDGRFDTIIVPYSTLQLIPTGSPQEQALQCMSATLTRQGRIMIDLSTSFNTRAEHTWRKVLVDECPELALTVTEWQHVTRRRDHVVLRYKYQSGKTLLAKDMELWFYHDHAEFSRLLQRLNLDVARCDVGYGPGLSAHRLIYHVVHKC